ncbi:hypothetical protein ACFV5G_12385 [Streptomyces sp. NPDC059766]|uniref:hypothetical protein n=1 Tax=Streptomyces sp. NPDC059766 TaxID=3346940 RepID=UPI003651D926
MVIEAVGTQESFMQAVGATRGGGHLGYRGVNHDVTVPGIEPFPTGIHTLGGPAPVRRFLPDLIQLIWDRKFAPGEVFDVTRSWTARRKAAGRWTSVAPPRSSSSSDLAEPREPRELDLPWSALQVIAPGLSVTSSSDGVLVKWTASDGFTSLAKDQPGASGDSMQAIVRTAVSGLLLQLGHTVTEPSNGHDLLVLSPSTS